ncbi:MAG: AbrB/MazE/SpoVT family DNA-binding domain-containing protein [Terricaulis sp.]|nr:AbrB/MazE/SpoVT family DNA-binding domain-containing protein [Terricaulis sp.]
MNDETKKPHGVSDTERFPFEAEAAAPKPAGRTLKVRRIGNSLGVVLPKDVLAKLNVGEGDHLSVSDTPDGVALTAFDDEVARQIEIGRDLMKRYRNALRELAK